MSIIEKNYKHMVTNKVNQNTASKVLTKVRGSFINAKSWLGEAYLNNIKVVTQGK